MQDVARGIGLDNRIGPQVPARRPGLRRLLLPEGHAARWLQTAQDHDAPMRSSRRSSAVNDARKRAMARKVADALGGDVRGKTVAVLGLTFKPNTDDMRDAPSIP